jgi:hypothetical protein
MTLFVIHSLKRVPFYTASLPFNYLFTADADVLLTETINSGDAFVSSTCSMTAVSLSSYTRIPTVFMRAGPLSIKVENTTGCEKYFGFMHG